MNKNTQKLVYVGFSFLHHGKHSGYDYIKNVVSYDKHIDCQGSINYLNSISFRKNLILKIYLILFGDRPWWVELRCIIYALFHRNLVFHFIYAEQLYRYTGLFKGKTNKIVCTLHQPADFYISRPAYLKRAGQIDKIIVMSPEMLEPLQNLFKNSKIVYIPHGVDSKYFKPVPEKRRRNILMVGNWLRNFGFANTVFQQLLSIDRTITVNVVSNKDNHHFFTRNEQLNLLSEINDAKLLDLYQSSEILFLPLIGFTANNALLEGAACGCKLIIATEQKFDSSYIDKKYIDILPFNEELVVSRIFQKLNNHDETMTNNLVNFVRNNYDWETIGKLSEDVIRSCKDLRNSFK